MVENETMGTNCVIGASDESTYQTVKMAGHTTVLGSRQKTTTIEELLSGREGDAAFTSFLSRVSTVVQGLSFTPIAINEFQKVTSACSWIGSVAVHQLDP